jgi:hypothetical protein
MNVTQLPGNTHIVTVKPASYQLREFFGDLRLEVRDAEGNEIRIAFESKLAFSKFLDTLCNAEKEGN